MANVRKIIDPNKGDPLHRKSEHVTSDAKPSTLAGREAARSKDPRIDVRIFQSKGGQLFPVGEFYAVAQMWSHVKPSFAVRGPMSLMRKSDREMDFEFGVLCGAMAERLNEVYGDNLDPDIAARWGAKKLAELIHAWKG